MEFIKVGDLYLVKGSNAYYVSEAEMNKMINKEEVIKDITSNECQNKKSKKGSVDNGSNELKPTQSNVEQETVSVTE